MTKICRPCDHSLRVKIQPRFNNTRDDQGPSAQASGATGPKTLCLRFREACKRRLSVARLQLYLEDDRTVVRVCVECIQDHICSISGSCVGHVCWHFRGERGFGWCLSRVLEDGMCNRCFRAWTMCWPDLSPAIGVSHLTDTSTRWCFFRWHIKVFSQTLVVSPCLHHGHHLSHHPSPTPAHQLVHAPHPACLISCWPLISRNSNCTMTCYCNLPRSVQTLSKHMLHLGLNTCALTAHVAIHFDVMEKMASTCPFFKYSYITFSCVYSFNERRVLDFWYILISLTTWAPSNQCKTTCAALIMDEPAFILSNAESMVVGIWLTNGSATHSPLPAFCWMSRWDQEKGKYFCDL